MKIIRDRSHHKITKKYTGIEIVIGIYIIVNLIGLIIGITVYLINN